MSSASGGGGGGGGGDDDNANRDPTVVAQASPSNRGCILFKKNTALTALSLSPNRDHVVTVGRDLLRVVRLDLEYETFDGIVASK